MIRSSVQIRPSALLVSGTIAEERPWIALLGEMRADLPVDGILRIRGLITIPYFTFITPFMIIQ